MFRFLTDAKALLYQDDNTVMNFLYPNNQNDGDVEVLMESAARRDLHPVFGNRFLEITLLKRSDGYNRYCHYFILASLLSPSASTDTSVSISSSGLLGEKLILIEVSASPSLLP